MEVVKEKRPTIKGRTQSEINIIRQESWLTQKELGLYMNKSDKEIEELLDDGFFKLSNASAKVDRLVYLESVDEYLKTGQRARSSDSIFAKKQKEKRELQERVEGMKTNLANKVNKINEQLRLAKITLESNKLGQLANESNMGFAHGELNKIATQLGI